MGRSAPPENANSSSIIIGMLVVLLLLVFFSLAFYAVPKYWHVHHQEKLERPAVSTAKIKDGQVPVTDPSSLTSNAPLYDFYTELKKPHGSALSLTKLTTPTTSTVGQFALQLAVFSDKKSARKLVDHLAIQGYQASIIKYKQGLGSLYRVFLGPYASVVASQRDQQHLSKLHVEFIVVPYQTTKKVAS